jgi:hypothetical protein
MSKKIMLLALAAVSAAMFAVPAMAMAEDIPNHVVPKPLVATPITGGTSTLQSTSGLKVTCGKVAGSATWTSSTTGKINLTFSSDCTENLFGTECGSIPTTELEFHLLTLPNNVPGILITSNNNHFATFTCTGGFVKVVVSGNGIIGKITSPACGGSSVTSKILFSQTAGVQAQKTVAGTETVYNLKSSTNGAAPVEAGQSGEGTVTFPESTKLECT